MLDVYEMYVFLAAAETENFSEAGRRLQLSQPAVSMQIRSLEDKLGVDLFHRAGRHIHLTEAGHALVGMARDLVNLAIRTEEAMKSMQGRVVGELKLACSTTSGKYILPKYIAGFVERYPDVKVVCNVVGRDNALQMLCDGEAHIGITSQRVAIREVEYRPFITDPVVLIVPPGHPWARCGSVTPDELRGGEFILREPKSGTQQAVADALSAHDIRLDDLKAKMVLGNSEAIHIAVAEGIGVAFISQRAAQMGIQNEQVVQVRVSGLAMRQQLYMARHAQRAATRAQAAFWDFVYTTENIGLLNGDDGSLWAQS